MINTIIILNVIQKFLIRWLRLMIRKIKNNLRKRSATWILHHQIEDVNLPKHQPMQLQSNTAQNLKKRTQSNTTKKEPHT